MRGWQRSKWLASNMIKEKLGRGQKSVVGVVERAARKYGTMFHSRSWMSVWVCETLDKMLVP